MNRLTAVRNSSGTALASYTYDSRSRRTALDYTNGAGADYSYDTASRLGCMTVVAAKSAFSGSKTRGVLSRTKC